MKLDYDSTLMVKENSFLRNYLSCHKTGLWKKKFSLRLEMILSVISCKRKNIIFYEKNLKFTKNITFNNVSLLSLFTNFLLIFKIGNSRVVENISPRKISDDLYTE